MEKEKIRNKIVDIIRGFAILTVILQHTISCSGVLNYENNIIFKILWSLQMPLFFLISGYVTKYSKTICSVRDLWVYIRKRSFSYLLPWAIWTIIVRGFLIEGWNIVELPYRMRYMVYNMDTMYWFFVAIWFICLIWGTGNFLANKVLKNKDSVLMTLIFSGIPTLIVLAIGVFKGINFLAIKFVLYYLPYYMAGYIYSKTEKIWISLRDVAVFIAMIVYSITLVKFNTYSAQDTLINIIVRMSSSFSGCIVFIYAVATAHSNSSQNFILNKIALAGRESFGLYVIHYLVLAMLKTRNPIEFMSLNGFAICAANYILTIAASTLIIYILSSNKYSRILIGKK